MKKLKLWNGAGVICRNHKDPRWKDLDPFKTHASIAAHSRADLRRLIAEYCGNFPQMEYLKNYYSECWGDDMEGITPQRGIWIAFDRWGEVIRVF